MSNRKPNQRSGHWWIRQTRRRAKAHAKRVRERVARMALRLRLSGKNGYVCIEDVLVGEVQTGADEWHGIYRGEQAVYRERGQYWGGKVFWSNRPESWRKLT